MTVNASELVYNITKSGHLFASNPPRNNQNSYNLHYVMHLNDWRVVFLLLSHVN